VGREIAGPEQSRQAARRRFPVFRPCVTLRWAECKRSTIWLKKVGLVYDLTEKLWPGNDLVYELTEIDTKYLLDFEAYPEVVTITYTPIADLQAPVWLADERD